MLGANNTGVSTPQKPISLNLPLDLVEELRAVGLENDRSLSYLARVALREWLDKTAGNQTTDGQRQAGADGSVVDAVQPHTPASSPTFGADDE